MDFFGEKWSSRACFGATRRRKLTIGGDSKSPTGSARSSRMNTGANCSLPVCTATAVRIYPMPVWRDIEKKLAQIPSTHPSRSKFLDRVNFYGQVDGDRQPGARGDSGAAARLGHDGRRSRCVRPVQFSRSVEPRAVRREAAARAVHRRRRARAVGSWSVGRRRMLHEPVMTREVLAFLQPEKGGVFVDCTVGMGGHALALLEAGATQVIGLDRDPGGAADRRRDAEQVPRSRRARAFGLSGDRVGAGGPRHRARRRHADRHGHVVVSARSRGPRLQLPARRPARHADGYDERA